MLYRIAPGILPLYGHREVVHSRRWLPSGGPEFAVVNIWRIGGDGLIAEGWEIIEPVAPAFTNVVRWSPHGDGTVGEPRASHWGWRATGRVLCVSR
ncbi:hypothetical protein [Dactylosporangium sp. CA-233914]|uniref:hypothetical protein n=1 Tax=Dactylosporangium sp. CA-233914 TaxID=3239934 RepID=UPI003D8CA71B